MIESLWAWIVLLFFWSVILTLVGIGLTETIPFMGYVTFIAFCVMVVVVISAAILGSIQFLEYNQAWPFTPE